MSKAPPKKKLLVKTNEVIAESINDREPVGAPIVAPIVEPPSLDVSIQAVKIDKRGKHPNVVNNLEKGREKLKAVWEEKRVAKAELVEKAVQKKVALKEKQKKQIMNDYGVDSLSTDEEAEEEVVVPVKRAKAVVKSAPPAPKKKTIRYVEEPESSEEEIVYVKRGAKKVASAPQMPSLIFY
jgi:hypothetical protein